MTEIVFFNTFFWGALPLVNN